MKVIILTAGLGTRLRPHTFSKPKPLVKVAGKPMLAHILDSLQSVAIDELIFVTGYLGHRIQDFVQSKYRFPTQFIEQTALRGQAHAIHLTRQVAHGPCMIVFGDGIIHADFEALNRQPPHGVIFVKEIDDPSRFGVVVLENDKITRLVEKPEQPISNLVVVGIYYLPDISQLFAAIEHVMSHNIQTKGEFYLADALQVMIDGGAEFHAERVSVWKDCGNPSALLDTNRYLLENGRSYVGSVTRSVIIPPVYIDETAMIDSSVIGPYVSVAARATIRDSRIRDSIINSGAVIQSIILDKSLIGDDAYVEGDFQEMNVGDASEIRFR
ncbi:MAG: NTP transferase domain-containing protein [Chloroflexaceae bacterium]|nr:NTP transferase domain-containing protein [Chloroflexaceae bacterium]